jgi:hypothetical protein
MTSGLCAARWSGGPVSNIGGSVSRHPSRTARTENLMNTTTTVRVQMFIIANVPPMKLKHEKKKKKKKHQDSPHAMHGIITKMSLRCQ